MSRTDAGGTPQYAHQGSRGLTSGRGKTVPGNIAEVLDASLSARPHATAIEAASGAWSYAELDDRARRAAGALWSLGVRPGDRVAACLPNDLDIIAAFHGSQRIGAVWAGIGEALTAGEQGSCTSCASRRPSWPDRAAG